MQIAKLLPVPKTLEAWQEQRLEIRERLWAVLGDLPARIMPQPKILSKSLRENLLVEHFVYDNGASANVFGYFLTPAEIKDPLPTVLYLHVHGNKYEQGKEEIFRERVPQIIPAKAFLEEGYAVMVIDAYCFGERSQHGTNPQESGVKVEHALYKHFLWQGTSLWGMMLRDDLMSLDYLVTRPEVDPTRIAITGMSLGGSRATWIAALDERPKAIIPVAQMTRWRNFAASGLYNGHGIYYYLPALLRENLDMEHLVALAAPRLQTILIGDQDPLSPIDGIQEVLEYTKKIYTLYGAEDKLTASIEKGIAHAYTPSMFDAMLASLRHALKASG